jgi:hypothetical protein
MDKINQVGFASSVAVIGRSSENTWNRPVG